jgi:hypothetical protein
MSDYSMTEPFILNSIRTFKCRVNDVVDAITSGDFVDDIKYALNISYKKRGGLHFAKVGDLSLSWSIKTKPAPERAPDVSEPAYTVNLESRISRFVR